MPAAAAGPQQLLSCSAALQLARWHTCLESLDRAELPLPCWHDVFAHLLLTGALRAFSFGYQQVSGPRPWESQGYNDMWTLSTGFMTLPLLLYAVITP